MSAGLAIGMTDVLANGNRIVQGLGLTGAFGLAVAGAPAMAAAATAVTAFAAARIIGRPKDKQINAFEALVAPEVMGQNRAEKPPKP